MISAICIVKATRSQKPAPNHCALCRGELPTRRVAPNTIATATQASENASGNQRSNHSESRKPVVASHDPRGPSWISMAPDDIKLGWNAGRSPYVRPRRYETAKTHRWCDTDQPPSPPNTPRLLGELGEFGGSTDSARTATY